MILSETKGTPHTRKKRFLSGIAQIIPKENVFFLCEVFPKSNIFSFDEMPHCPSLSSLIFQGTESRESGISRRLQKPGKPISGAGDELSEGGGQQGGEGGGEEAGEGGGGGEAKGEASCVQA